MEIRFRDYLKIPKGKEVNESCRDSSVFFLTKTSNIELLVTKVLIKQYF